MKTQITIDTETRAFQVCQIQDDGSCSEFAPSTPNEEVLRDSLEWLRDLVIADLEDIWKRIDRLEDKIAGGGKR